MNYVSLGYFCSIAMELEKLGLRKESSPFDWTISDFEGVILAIQNHFEDYLHYDYLSQDKNCREYYQNVKYNIHFYHENDKYRPLEKQLPRVQRKYDRRIERFYKSIAEPTLFVRYISDGVKVEGKSRELIWIEENYEKIMILLKSFNPNNDILFIANNGVKSERFTIYNVEKDENDTVARNPIHKNLELFKRFSSIDHPDREANIKRYREKCRHANSLRNRAMTRLKYEVKKIFLKEYSHEKQY